MDTDGLFAVDPDDLPLLAAAGAIAIGSILVITDIGSGHPLVAMLLVGGTIAFVGFTLQRVPEYNGRIAVAAVTMVLGSALVAVEFDVGFDFDGPLGAALFLVGAVGLAKYLDE